MQQSQIHPQNHSRSDPAGVREATRFAVVVVAVSVAFLGTAVVWVSTCTGATADIVACGVPQRALLAAGAPAILLVGALRAWLRTYQSWRRRETWWAWQATAWVLMSLTLLVGVLSLPSLAGPGLFGG